MLVAAKGGKDLDDEAENSILGHGDMPAERISEAERLCDKLELDKAVAETDQETKFKFAGEKQLSSLVEWAKHIPHFAELAIDDQVALLKGGWNELLIAGFAHRSLGLQSGEFVQRR